VVDVSWGRLEGRGERTEGRGRWYCINVLGKKRRGLAEGGWNDGRV